MTKVKKISVKKTKSKQVALGKLDVHMQNKMKSDQCLSLGTNSKTNRIKDPNVKPGTLKFIEENIGSTHKIEMWEETL